MTAPASLPELPSAPRPVGFVDETLLETLLGLTPEERLRLNDRMVVTIQELRDGFAAAEPDHAAAAMEGTPPLRSIGRDVLLAVSREGLGLGELRVLEILLDGFESPRAG